MICLSKGNRRRFGLDVVAALEVVVVAVMSVAIPVWGLNPLCIDPETVESEGDEDGVAGLCCAEE